MNYQNEQNQQNPQYNYDYTGPTGSSNAPGQYAQPNYNQAPYGAPVQPQQQYSQQQYDNYGQQQVQPEQIPGYGNSQQLGMIDPKEEDVLDQYEVSDRMQFVRKVYAILATQLTITALFIVAVQTSTKFNHFFQTGTGLTIYIIAAILSIVFCLMIICCYGRTSPWNYYLLFGFTLCESIMVSGITAQYNANTVMAAGAATALTTVALTIYAFRTKVQVEVFGAMIFVVYFAMLPIGILGMFMFNNVLYMLYNILGVLFYSLFLIIDTMFICKGNKSMGGYSAEFDDYVIGAMMLYMDIIMLFIYLLRIFGNSNN